MAYRLIPCHFEPWCISRIHADLKCPFITLRTDARVFFVIELIEQNVLSVNDP